MQKTIFLFPILFSVFFILSATSCGKDDEATGSSEKQITSFKIKDMLGVINEEDKTIELTFLHTEDIDLTKLTPVVQVSLGATVSPKSGEVVDFTNPVNYVVTAENKSRETYKVTVIKEKSNEAKISKIEFEGITVERFILHEPISTIEVQVPYGTDVKALKPIITFTGKEISPSNGEVQDFTRAIEYTVVAEDGTEVKYNVAVIFGNFTNMEIHSVNKNPIKVEERFIIKGIFPPKDNIVFVGGEKVTVVRNSATELEVIAPVLSSGLYDIKVQNDGVFLVHPKLANIENVGYPIIKSVLVKNNTLDLLEVTITGENLKRFKNKDFTIHQNMIDYKPTVNIYQDAFYLASDLTFEEDGSKIVIKKAKIHVAGQFEFYITADTESNGYVTGNTKQFLVDGPTLGFPEITSITPSVLKIGVDNATLKGTNLAGKTVTMYRYYHDPSDGGYYDYVYPTTNEFTIYPLNITYNPIGKYDVILEINEKFSNAVEIEYIP
ncbi:DUF5018 domain-containing protein [Dysgonomonas sp. ZJ709]|uniref:DUF5018 domain-containing protein n=1 Tax=Dysgonomonas sp. ZJ709 TaxID=2709797 RepID=UPI0013EDCAED|nr:DUF5018 domain-containing protein [Dysgonomonas sp. ZJ709]